MIHPITPNTYLVTLAAPFDYLSEGVTYLATIRHHSKRSKRAGKVESIRFDRQDHSSGTTLRAYQWPLLLAQEGVQVLPHPDRPRR